MRKTLCGALCLLFLAGCYGPVDINYHEPTRYNGPKDPLLAKERSSEQQDLLLERFKMGQIDRCGDEGSLMKPIRCILAIMLLLAAAGGCSQVKEPWVTGDDQLIQERARSAEAQEDLVHRLRMGQTDR